MTEELADAPKQRCCQNCHEWYDARASQCYLCGEEAPEGNYALKKAVETERLNTNLSRQANQVRGEAAATRTLDQARRAGRPHDGALPVNGYRDLVGSIKASLENAGF